MSLPTHARTVIIGGGVIGCSIAYHLAKAGRQDIVVLERSKLTSGTTWHAAGLVRRLRPSATLTKLINYSIDLYQELEQETGQHTGWVQTGSLTLATNQDRLTNIQRQVSLGRAFGLDAEVVDARLAQELWPLLDVDDVIGAVWSPADGRVNPSDVTLALSKGAKARGVQFFEDTKVTGLRKQAERIAGVEVGEHVIEAEEVVIACGLWSREVAAMAGAHMPLYACEHFYFLTKPIAGIDGHLPTLNDQDNYFYARDDVGGLLLGSFEPNAKGLPMDKLPNDFSFDLLDEDWDHFMPIVDSALQRIPALQDAEVRMLLNGPESFTLDSQFMLGESPEVPGLFMLGGMNSTGIALAGGAGRALAEWMLAGEATMDLNEADIRRFSPAMNVLGALQARIPEVLGRHYDNPYAGRTMQTARNQRLSPVHQQMQQQGAFFTAMVGWERALHFGGEEAHLPLTFGAPAWRQQVGEEVQACIQGAGLFDQSAYGKIQVQGKDACALLNYLCPANMDVAVNKLVYTPIMNQRGGYEADVTIQRHSEDSYLLITGVAELVRSLMQLRRYAGDYQVSITDVTSAWAILGLAGAEAEAVMQRACFGQFKAPARFTMHSQDLGLAQTWVAGLNYTGQPGYEIYVPAEMAPTAYSALLEAGAQSVGMYAVTSLRIEAGHRAWGHEMGPGTLPGEVGYDKLTKQDKDYLGKAKQEAYPTGKQLVSLVFDQADAIPIHDEPIWYQGRVIGQITSAAWNYRLGTSQALAMLSHCPDGLLAGQTITGVEVEIACQRYKAAINLQAIKEWLA